MLLTLRRCKIQSQSEEKQSKTTTEKHKAKYPPPQRRPRSIFLEAPSLPAKVSDTSIYDLVKALLSLALAEAN